MGGGTGGRLNKELLLLHLLLLFTPLRGGVKEEMDERDQKED